MSKILEMIEKRTSAWDAKAFLIVREIRTALFLKKMLWSMTK